MATGWIPNTARNTCGPGSRHYYIPGLSFYNYPYTFGQLFGTGLFAIYQQRGADFIPEYKRPAFLDRTGHRR